MTNAMKILACLEAADGPRRTSTIAAETGIDRAQVEIELRILRDFDKAHADTRGSWFAGKAPVAA